MTMEAIAAARQAPLWDFQWSGAHLAAQGRDPYDAYLGGDQGVFVATQYPNYAPLLYLLLLPLGMISLATASALWTAVNVALAIAAGVMVGRGAGLNGIRVAGLTALTLCSLSYYDAVSKGQLSLVVLAAIVLAARSQKDWLTGSGLALALTKYSFAPLAFVWVARQRWRAIAFTAALHAVGAVALARLTGAGLVQVVAGPLQVARTMYPGSGSLFTLAQVGGGEGNWAILIAVLGALGLGLSARRTLAHADWVASLAAASLISLATFPHLLYDYCLLLPVAAVAFRMRGWWRPVALAPLAVLWFPWAVGGVHPYATAWVIIVFALSLASLLAVCRGGAVGAADGGRSQPVWAAASTGRDST